MYIFAEIRFWERVRQAIEFLRRSKKSIRQFGSCQGVIHDHVLWVYILIFEVALVHGVCRLTVTAQVLSQSHSGKANNTKSAFLRVLRQPNPSEFNLNFFFRRVLRFV